MNREVSYENMKALEEDNVNLRMESERLASLNLAITLEWREELNKVRGENRDLKEFNRNLHTHVAALKVSLQLEEGARQDDVRYAETLKGYIGEIYALRGEDPEVARICNRALA